MNAQSPIEHLYKKERVSDLFTPLAQEPDLNITLCDDKSLAVCWHCALLAGMDSTGLSRITNALNAEFVAKTHLQIVLSTSDNINSQTTNFLMMRSGKSNASDMAAAKSRVDYLKDRALNEYPRGKEIKNFNMYITFKHPIKDFEPSEDEIDLMKELTIITEKNLATCGFNPKALDTKAYLEMMSNMLLHGTLAGWNDNLPIQVDENTPMNQQALDWGTSIEVKKNCVKIGDWYAKTSSVKRYPDHVYPGYGINYLGDPLTGVRGLNGQFIICMNIYYPDVQKTRSALDKKRGAMVAQASSPLAKFVPVVHQRARSLTVLNECLEEGDRPVKIYMSVVNFGKTEEEVETNAANAKSYFSELRFQLLTDKFFTLPFLLNSIPYGSDRKAIDEVARYRTMTTRHAAALLPVFGDWKGGTEPLLTYYSRNGQLMTVSPYQSMTNKNICIFAVSGSGKSYSANNLIINTLAVGGLVWVIDIGYSYERLAGALDDAEFLDFQPNSNLCLNPFPLVQDIDEEIDMLKGLIAQMAAPTTSLDDYQLSTINEVIKEMYAIHGGNLNVDIISEKCLEHHDQRITDIGTQLYAFTSKGQYGKYFVGENNVTFNSRMTVLELEALAAKPQLQQLVLLQLIYSIQQKMNFGDKSVPKLLLIDEAYALLTPQGKGGENVARFIEYGFRRFRKVNGAGCVISQSVLDLSENPTGRAILENSSNIWLMSQKGGTIETLKKNKILPVPDGAYDLMKTVHTSKGQYSETFFISEMGMGIGRLSVGAYEDLLYSTKPDDVQAIRDKIATGLTTGEAINAVLQDRGIK